MQIVKFEVGPMASNAYLLWDEDTKDAVLVDPGYDDPRFMELIQKHGLKLNKILLTHGHFDHIGGLNKIREATGAKVYIPESDASCLTDPAKNLSTMVGGPLLQSEPADVLMKDGDTLEISPAHKLTVIETPGHTQGSACFVGEDFIISGDTLFQGSIGRTDFPGGDYATMMRSLEKLMTYGDDMRVLPGHGDITTIGSERRSNPFLA